MDIHSNTFDQTQKLKLGESNSHPASRDVLTVYQSPGFHEFVFSKCLKCHRVGIA